MIARESMLEGKLGKEFSKANEAFDSNDYNTAALYYRIVLYNLSVSKSWDKDTLPYHTIIHINLLQCEVEEDVKNINTIVSAISSLSEWFKESWPQNYSFKKLGEDMHNIEEHSSIDSDEILCEKSEVLIAHFCTKLSKSLIKAMENYCDPTLKEYMQLNTIFKMFKQTVTEKMGVENANFFMIAYKFDQIINTFREQANIYKTVTRLNDCSCTMYGKKHPRDEAGENDNNKLMRQSNG